MGQPQSNISSVVMDTPKSYPTKDQQSPNRKPQARKPPPPHMGSFFDAQMAAPLPHAHAKKPNRPKNDFNFYFEVASTTPQPASSTKSHSNNSNSSSRKSSHSSYPSSYKKCTRTTTTASSSSSSSSTTSTTIASEHNELSLKQKKASDYVVIQGRKYWKGNGSQNFLLPYDDDELDRLMTLHYILKSIFQGNFTAPVGPLLEKTTEKVKVLDIGCGAGTWILEMATEFPHAEFVGIDQCPGFPTHIKPGNSRFIAHDVLKGLPFKDQTFDFVYMRMMAIYFTPEELSNLLLEISRIMKPGAYFEIVDTNYTVRHAGPVTSKAINTDLKSILYTGSLAQKMIQQDSGTNHPIFSYLLMGSSPQQPAKSFIGNFIDISQEYVSLPLGRNDNQVCALHTTNFKSFLNGLRPKDPQTSPLLTQHVIDDVMDECERFNSQMDWFACFARKPPMDNQEIDQNTLESIQEFVEGFIDV